ncbi:DNA polymerase III subunit gamma/tau [Bartonella sp. M0192]|uniref:DNA polymerase III subunit gamma/tau n=1 Tax=Bartonella TaxID=773 RepID=UPI0018DD7E47|nr:DNA polymerase III subunit gamma/tau [Bartonella sp. P0291]MBH9996445.1 DNA polymerase III subunit gamma/tau [Bartonella sp. M0192]MBH9998606.1 DNA polymerase III subunit gamma/tau [Bartonella sp. M0191]MBI0007932.1 DNA polymerase III subunit gamma/tau [Bartonella sp. M0193]MBI0009896.1 DNA polymerase III subunit gamma/tau [Bartonella sp. M0176]MBI0012983.1 DNA polymerase III subunit gamma/tau [Bartonella apihabitans]
MESTEAETGYRVLARKYRPQNFSDLIGQEPMVRTLTNAFDSGRIPQAWMLTGVRGVGKTTTARILARALNYKTDTIDKPTIHMDKLGEHCKAIMEGRHVDVIEMDAASHTGIDDIREIIEQVRYRPVAARFKVYIIDEVHMLSTQAFNGLLKTLEEPPPHVKFIFATTEIRKVPVTVLSRCQRYNLRRVDSNVLAAHLRKISDLEKIEAEDSALAMIARAGEGSVRDALSILDQAIAHGGGKVDAASVRTMLGLADRTRIIDLFEMIMKGDVAGALKEFRDQYDGGADPLVILNELADFNHLVTRLRFTPEIADDISLVEEERERGLDFSKKLSVRVLSSTWQMLLKGTQEVDSAASPIDAAEMLLIRLTHAADLPTLDEALKALGEGKPAIKLPQSSDVGKAADDSHGVNVDSGKNISEQKSAQENTLADNSTSHSNANQTESHETARAESDNSAHNNTRTEQGNFQGPSPQKAPTMQLVSTSSAALEPDEQALQDTAKNNETAEKNSEPEVNKVILHSLQDVVDLADKHNDMQFKLLVKEFVRPVSFRQGRIEFEPAEGMPRFFAHDIAKMLREWTGERWTVTVVNEGGGLTLREEDEKAHQALLSDAEADPDIAKILRYFPGSKIVDVRVNKSDDGLDLTNNDDMTGEDDENDQGE